jgi:hypothetical protein
VSRRPSKAVSLLVSLSLLFTSVLGPVPVQASTASPTEGRVDVVQERGGSVHHTYQELSKTDWGKIVGQSCLGGAISMATFGIGVGIDSAISGGINAVIQGSMTAAQQIASAAIQAVINALIQGLVQGIQAAATGGDFWQGFGTGALAGLISGAISVGVDALGELCGKIGGDVLKNIMNPIMEFGGGYLAGYLSTRVMLMNEDDLTNEEKRARARAVGMQQGAIAGATALGSSIAKSDMFKGAKNPEAIERLLSGGMGMLAGAAAGLYAARQTGVEGGFAGLSAAIGGLQGFAAGYTSASVAQRRQKQFTGPDTIKEMAAEQEKNNVEHDMIADMVESGISDEDILWYLDRQSTQESVDMFANQRVDGYSNVQNYRLAQDYKRSQQSNALKSYAYEAKKEDLRDERIRQFEAEGMSHEDAVAAVDVPNVAIDIRLEAAQAVDDMNSRELYGYAVSGKLQSHHTMRAGTEAWQNLAADQIAAGSGALAGLPVTTHYARVRAEETRRLKHEAWDKKIQGDDEGNREIDTQYSEIMSDRMRELALKENMVKTIVVSTATLAARSGVQLMNAGFVDRARKERDKELADKEDNVKAKEWTVGKFEDKKQEKELYLTYQHGAEQANERALAADSRIGGFSDDGTFAGDAREIVGTNVAANVGTVAGAVTAYRVMKNDDTHKKLRAVEQQYDDGEISEAQYLEQKGVIERDMRNKEFYSSQLTSAISGATMGVTAAAFDLGKNIRTARKDNEFSPKTYDLVSGDVILKDIEPVLDNDGKVVDFKADAYVEENGKLRKIGTVSQEGLQDNGDGTVNLVGKRRGGEFVVSDVSKKQLDKLRTADGNMDHKTFGSDRQKKKITSLATEDEFKGLAEYQALSGTVLTHEEKVDLLVKKGVIDDPAALRLSQARVWKENRHSGEVMYKETVTKVQGKLQGHMLLVGDPSSGEKRAILLDKSNFDENGKLRTGLAGLKTANGAVLAVEMSADQTGAKKEKAAAFDTDIAKVDTRIGENDANLKKPVAVTMVDQKGTSYTVPLAAENFDENGDLKADLTQVTLAGGEKVAIAQTDAKGRVMQLDGDTAVQVTALADQYKRGDVKAVSAADHKKYADEGKSLSERRASLTAQKETMTAQADNSDIVVFDSLELPQTLGRDVTYKVSSTSKPYERTFADARLTLVNDFGEKITVDMSDTGLELDGNTAKAGDTATYLGHKYRIDDAQTIVVKESELGGYLQQKAGLRGQDKSIAPGITQEDRDKRFAEQRGAIVAEYVAANEAVHADTSLSPEVRDAKLTANEKQRDERIDELIYQYDFGPPATAQDERNRWLLDQREAVVVEYMAANEAVYADTSLSPEAREAKLAQNEKRRDERYAGLQDQYADLHRDRYAELSVANREMGIVPEEYRTPDLGNTKITLTGRTGMGKDTQVTKEFADKEEFGRFLENNGLSAQSFRGMASGGEKGELRQINTGGDVALEALRTVGAQVWNPSFVAGTAGAWTRHALQNQLYKNEPKNLTGIDKNKPLKDATIKAAGQTVSATVSNAAMIAAALDSPLAAGMYVDGDSRRAYYDENVAPVMENLMERRLRRDQQQAARADKRRDLDTVRLIEEKYTWTGDSFDAGVDVYAADDIRAILLTPDQKLLVNEKAAGDAYAAAERQINGTYVTWRDQNGRRQNAQVTTADIENAYTRREEFRDGRRPERYAGLDERQKAIQEKYDQVYARVYSQKTDTAARTQFARKMTIERMNAEYNKDGDPEVSRRIISAVENVADGKTSGDDNKWEKVAATGYAAITEDIKGLSARDFESVAVRALSAQSRRVPVSYMSSEVQGKGVFEAPVVPEVKVRGAAQTGDTIRIGNGIGHPFQITGRSNPVEQEYRDADGRQQRTKAVTLTGVDRHGDEVQLLVRADSAALAGDGGSVSAADVLALSYDSDNAARRLSRLNDSLGSGPGGVSAGHIFADKMRRDMQSITGDFAASWAAGLMAGAVYTDVERARDSGSSAEYFIPAMSGPGEYTDPVNKQVAQREYVSGMVILPAIHGMAANIAGFVKQPDIGSVHGGPRDGVWSRNVSGEFHQAVMEDPESRKALQDLGLIDEATESGYRRALLTRTDRGEVTPYSPVARDLRNLGGDAYLEEKPVSDGQKVARGLRDVGAAAASVMESGVQAVRESHIELAKEVIPAAVTWDTPGRRISSQDGYQYKPEDVSITEVADYARGRAQQQTAKTDADTPFGLDFDTDAMRAQYRSHGEKHAFGAMNTITPVAAAFDMQQDYLMYRSLPRAMITGGEFTISRESFERLQSDSELKAQLDRQGIHLSDFKDGADLAREIKMRAPELQAVLNKKGLAGYQFTDEQKVALVREYLPEAAGKSDDAIEKEYLRGSGGEGSGRWSQTQSLIVGKLRDRHESRGKMDTELTSGAYYVQYETGPEWRYENPLENRIPEITLDQMGDGYDNHRISARGHREEVTVDKRIDSAWREVQPQNYLTRDLTAMEAGGKPLSVGYRAKEVVYDGRDMITDQPEIPTVTGGGEDLFESSSSDLKFDEVDVPGPKLQEQPSSLPDQSSTPARRTPAVPAAGELPVPEAARSPVTRRERPLPVTAPKPAAAPAPLAAQTDLPASDQPQIAYRDGIMKRQVSTNSFGRPLYEYVTSDGKTFSELEYNEAGAAEWYAKQHVKGKEKELEGFARTFVSTDFQKTSDGNYAVTIDGKTTETTLGGAEYLLHERARKEITVVESGPYVPRTEDIVYTPPHRDWKTIKPSGPAPELVLNEDGTAWIEKKPESVPAGGAGWDVYPATVSNNRVPSAQPAIPEREAR